MTTLPEFQAKMEKLPVNLDRMDGFVNGPASGPNSEVAVDGGRKVKTVARLAAEAAVDAGTYVRIDGSNLDDSAARDLGDRISVDVGGLVGLRLMPHATTGSVTIDIAPGICNDSTGSIVMRLSGTLSKNLNGSWVYGDYVGGLDFASWGANRWYHVHLICTSAGIVDALISTSPNAPIMPAGFVFRRYLGSFLTFPPGDPYGRAGIRPFVQDGDWMWFEESIMAVTAEPNGVPNYRFLTCPPGFKSRVHAYFESNAGADSAGWLSFRDPDRGDYANVAEQANFFRPNQFFIQTFEVVTDNFGRIFTGVAPVTATDTISIRCHGFAIDRRVYR